MSRDLWGLYPLRSPSQFNVTVGNRLTSEWGRTQQLVPTQDAKRTRDIRDGIFKFGPETVRQQQPPIPLIPSGVAPSLVNKAMERLLNESQLFTLYWGDFVTADPEDEKYYVRWRQLEDIRNGATDYSIGVKNIGAAFVDPGFWDYAKRKMDQQQEAAYKLWKLNQVQKMERPEEREWWMKKFPEFVPLLKKGKKRMMKIMSRVADIRIKGVQSEKDLRFLWEISMGVFTPSVELDGGKKVIPPKDAVEAEQFPGLQTDPNREFPGIQGPARETLPMPGVGGPIQEIPFEGTGPVLAAAGPAKKNVQSIRNQ